MRQKAPKVPAEKRKPGKAIAWQRNPKMKPIRFGRVINDEELAKEAEQVEKMAEPSPDKSRALIKTIIEAHYTKPE